MIIYIEQSLWSSYFVSDTPNFKFSLSEDNDTFTIETVSLTPAILTWKICSNDR